MALSQSFCGLRADILKLLRNQLRQQLKLSIFRQAVLVEGREEGARASTV